MKKYMLLAFDSETNITHVVFFDDLYHCRAL